MATRYLVLTWVERNCLHFQSCIAHTLKILRHNTGFSTAETLFPDLMRHTEHKKEYILCVLDVHVDSSGSQPLDSLRSWDAPEGFSYFVLELAADDDHMEVARNELKRIELEIVGKRPSLYVCGLPYRVCVDAGLTTRTV